MSLVRGHRTHDNGPLQFLYVNWVSELTEAQPAVLEPPYIYHRPLINDDGSVESPRRG